MKQRKTHKYKVTISLIFGLLGFAANFYTIDFSFPPYTATVLIGLLFPMLITLTWGWKYGLLSALVGGCQSMWWLWGPSNGYATFLVVPPFTLWIVWHGLFANLRRKQRDHGWWLNAYAVEIPFRILSTVNLYTLSRWAITLNPPPWSWASGAPNTIPMPFSNFVVIKQAVVGYVILLLADVLLNFGFIRRFFKLKEDYNQANTGYITSASLLLGVLFWVLDSVLDYLEFHVGGGSFLDLVVLNVPPDELFERTVFILACLIGGLLSSRFLRKQRQAEAAIRESEERFRTLVETAPSLLQICDAKGNNIYVSPNCEEMTGYTQEELLSGVVWWVYEDDTSRAKEFFERTFREGVGGRDFEYQAVKKNGELWVASSSWEPFRDEEGKFKGVIFQTIDITERTRAEEKLKQTLTELAASQAAALNMMRDAEDARKVAEQANKDLRREIEERKRVEAELQRSNTELEQFAYVASHDLQEPLRKVQAFGGRLGAIYASALDERGRDYLERMQGAAHRMQGMINGLLTFSRVATHAQPFAPVDLHQAANEAVSDLEIRIEQTGGRVEVGPSAGSGRGDLPTIEAEPTQMRQLLVNLIGNGLKFHRDGIAPVVKVYSKATGDARCQVFVEDNGIGFDKKYLDRIFQPFQRLHGRSAYEGSGIGLAICNKIAERHGGSITAESAPGEGATFIVTLPVCQGRKE